MWPVRNNGITQFYLPPTHEPYLRLLPSSNASPPIAPTHEGMARLSGPVFMYILSYATTKTSVLRDETIQTE